MTINEIESYAQNFSEEEKAICKNLSQYINTNLSSTESKLWHGHPVWFIEGNPIVGFSKEKKGIRLMFWSGKDFNEEALNVHGQKFKDTSIFFNSTEEIHEEDLTRWLHKAEQIQWDYKNIVKRKGELVRLK